MNLLFVASILLVLIHLVPDARCSHFRGGVISWRPVDETVSSPPYEIELTYSIAWRRSFNSGLRCDATTVANQTLLRGEDTWTCSGASCIPRSNRLSFVCTDFSIAEDWTLGKRSIRINVTSIAATKFRVGYEGCCWINLQRGGRDWDVWTSVNLTQRNDTGLINSSPVSISSPIVRVQHGCNHTFQIRVTDPNNDIVKCRWAMGSAECGGVCNGLEPQFSTIDERACVLRYRAIGGIGWYAVALMIEDFASPLETEPLSSVPLQFLVNVYSSNAPCTTKPEFLSPTRVDDSCIGIPVDTIYEMAILAKGGSLTDNIRDISTVSPIGMNKSPLQQTDNSSISRIDLTWRPSTQQLGQNLFCFTAESSGGFSSDQRCVTFLVGTIPPQLQMNSFDPVPGSEILENHLTWRVTFDTKFKRPLRQTLIFFNFKNGTVAHTIDVSSSADVRYPVFNDRQLIINAPAIKLLERFEYYITLESGIARGLTFCGAESDALTSNTAWTFRIKDVTPPVLTFDGHNRRSNSSIMITWSFNEPANSSCTLINPAVINSFPDCISYRWSGDNLVEGTYNLFVTGTDEAGNVAQPESLSWFVDLTAPTVIISTTPKSASSETSSEIVFRCSESNCQFVCSLSEDDPNSPFLIVSPTNCDQQTFTTSSLEDGKTYTFNVYAVDSVGNRGQVTSFQWIVDLIKPVIQNITSVLLKCGDDFRPSSIGTPTVTDTRDLNPKLTYADHPVGNCTLRRTWTAVDSAGNSVQLNQSLIFNSPKEPQVLMPLSVVIPCTGTLDTGRTGEELIASGLLSHPCNRSMTVTSNDLPPLDRCDMTATRLWRIIDDCGQSLSFSQSVRILSLQLPGSPVNGELNVELNRALSWPDYPNTEDYLVYIWPFGSPRPALPVSTLATGNTREYRPPNDQPYPANTRMAWQVEFRLRDGFLVNNQSIVPSPIWAFETKKFADLSVIEVNMPSQVFTGRSFDVSWKVENIGSIGTSVFRWSDRVYLSPSSTPGGSRLLQKVVRQESFLDPGDAYTGKWTFDIPQNMLGQHYLFVESDTYRQVTESSVTSARENNIATSLLPIDVKLTPPPDLQVTVVTMPTTTFSGQTIIVRWTVENKGVGATDVSSWFDGIYWSTDNATTTNNRLLKRQRRDVGLLQGGEYTSSTTINVPREIFGEFYFVVVVDDTRVIYEHTREDNNAQVSAMPIGVLLSPPPDLIVTTIVMPSSAQSEDQLEIQYTVENSGAGSPYLTWWRDIIIIRHLSGTRQHTIGVSGYSGQLPPGASYSRSISFTIPSQFDDGQYTVTVTTDYQNQIFEFTNNRNNDRNASLSIQQSLSDLKTDVVRVIPSIPFGSDGFVELLVEWTVTNAGEGSSPARVWTDLITIKYDDQVETILGIQKHNQLLLPSSNYSESRTFQLGRPTSLSATILVKTDSTDTVFESNENNNVESTQTTAIPVIFDSLAFETISVSIESDDGQTLEVSEVVAGQEFILSWTVRNDAQYVTSGVQWTDAIYLMDPSVTDVTRYQMIAEEHNGALQPGESYTVVRKLTLPLSLFGFYILEGILDEVKQLSSNPDQSSNLYSSELFVTLPPSSDLIAQEASFTLLQPAAVGGFSSLQVAWTTINDGNTMATLSKWRDSVLVSNDKNNPFGAGSILLDSFDIDGLLQSKQTYFRNKTVIVPGNIFGDVWVFVALDSGNSIEEINGELNNFKRSNQLISLPRSLQPNLNTLITSSTPINSTGGDTLRIEYRVLNNGGTTVQSSWTDTVRALINDDVIGEQEFLLLTHRRLGPLEFGESYTVQQTVTLPAYVTGAAHIVVESDSFHRTSDDDIVDNSDETRAFFVIASDLPNLSVTFSSAQKSSRSGEPITIDYIVNNGGSGSVATSNHWYDKLYLSTDSLLDPFDTVLGVANKNILVPPNGTYAGSITGNIPFDLFEGTYYLLMQTDSINIVRESDEDDNIVIQPLSLLEGFSTDMAVRSIIVPTTTGPLQQFTATWEIINNGSVDATGYKCDTVYFSLDSKWQINDPELGVDCGFVSLAASISISNQLEMSIPLVAQQQYHTLVKTRSNIKDANSVNNIAASIGNTTMIYPILLLETIESNTFKSDEFKVWRVADVPASKTLVVKLLSNSDEQFFEVFVRSREPASPLAFDATGSDILSSNQTVIVANTRRGDYYIYVRSIGSLTVSTSLPIIQIIVKIAKFEIESVNPSVGGVSGSVTLRIDGTLFPPDALVSLVHSGNGNRFNADAVYRYSSTQLYASFNFTHFAAGDKFNVEMTDDITNEKAAYADGIRAVDGQRGEISTRVDNPGALRPNAVGLIVLDIQNIGDNDVIVPFMIFSVGNGAETTLLTADATAAAGNWTNQIRFLALASEGPSGIIRPKGTSRISFQVRQTDPGPASISLALATFPSNSKDPNPYLDANQIFKPIGFSDSRWSVVWDAVKNNIGSTVSELAKRLSQLANHLSLLNRKLFYADDLIAYEANLAEGFHMGTVMNSVTDLSLEEESASSLPLGIHRLFSPRRSHRGVDGPFGRGWTSLYWSLKINGVYGTIIILEKDNEFHQFILDKTSSSNDRFIHPALGVIQMTNEEIIYEKDDVTATISYVFSRSTLQLSRVQSSQYGGSTSISRDLSDKIKKLTTDDGYYIEVSYSSAGFITETRSFSPVRLLHIASYEYEASNLRRVIFDSDKTTSYEYATDGGLSKITNPSGTWTEYLYSTTGTSLGLGHYNSNGKLLREAKYSEDGLGQLKLTDYPSRQETRFLYNDVGELASSRTKGSSPIKILRKGRTLRQTLVDDLILNEENYDASSATLTVTNGNGAIVKLRLKENGDLLSLTDSAGFIYSANYTDQSLLSKIVYPDGSYEEFLYDSNGQLNAFINRNKKRIDFIKDSETKITRKDVEGSESTLMSYYSNGQLREAWNNKSRVSFQYDNENRPLRIEYDRNRAVNYRYDPVGRRKAMFDDTGDYNVSYIYDIVGRLVAVNNHGVNPQNLLTVGFDSKGKMMQRQTADGSRAQYHFDDNDFKLLELVNKAGDGSTIDSFTYNYDKRGRKLNATTSQGTWKYSHDAISQLLSFESPKHEVSEISYDGNKNRQSVTSDSATKTTYEVNNLNQFVSTDTGMSFDYDMNGNLITIKDTNNNDNILKQFQYDEEGRYIGTRSLTSTCTYQYDAISNPKSRTCGSETIEYLIDPYGFHGADILAEFDAVLGNITFYYHGMEQGLIAKMIKSTQKMYYYQFDDIGSVTSITEDNGSLVVNRYEYDPFGTIISKSEQIRNEYLFVGQWGVRQIHQMDSVYVMRSRLYDGGLGRFLRPDSYGFAGRSTNLYCYVENNPLHEKDPRGQFIPLAVLGGAALIGAITNVGVYVATQAATGGFSGASGWDIAGGIAGAAASGALLGAGTAAVAAWAPVAAVGIGAMAVVGGVAGLAGSAIEQGINSKPWSWSSFAEAGVIGALTGNIPLKMIGYAGRGASAFGRIGNILFKNIMNGATKTGQALWKSMGVAALAGNLAGAFWNSIKPHLDTMKNAFDNLVDKIKNLYDSFLDWIRSIDPNDILGPAGYGDARFVANDIIMSYKIRFENHINASAPAQKVSIKASLDPDLDVRTFVIDGWGFGNFTFTPRGRSSLLQEVKDMTKELNFFVRIFAGVNFVTGQAQFSIEALDPQTGQAPDDPRVGFLPPNPENGTDGQGYVAYSIKAKKTTKTFDVIDATASIVFDRNEAIETPPIFNTIDSSAPSLNTSVVTSLFDSETLLLNIAKADEGSGLNFIDFFVERGGKLIEVAMGVNESFVVLPLPPGSTYTIHSSAVDFVGNRLQTNAPGNTPNIIVFPSLTVSCDGVANCSGFGNCTGRDLCACRPGHYGVDCSLTDPPLEPPILTVRPASVLVNRNMTLPIYARLSDAKSQTLTVIIGNVPPTVSLSAGKRNGSRVVLNATEISNVMLFVDDFTFTLSITAIGQSSDGRTVSRFASLTITVTSELANVPSLSSEATCYDYTTQTALIMILASLRSTSGVKETLHVNVTGVPSGFNIVDGMEITAGTFSINVTSLPNVTLSRSNSIIDFTATALSVSASAVADSSGDVETNVVAVLVSVCPSVSSTTLQPTTTDAQIPTSDDEDDDDWVIIVAVIVPFLIIVIIIIAVMIIAKKRRNSEKMTLEQPVELGSVNNAY